MSEENDQRARLERRAEVLKSRLIRTVDTLADRKMVHAVASTVMPSSHPGGDRLRYLLVGAGAGAAGLLGLIITGKILRAILR